MVYTNFKGKISEQLTTIGWGRIFDQTSMAVMHGCLMCACIVLNQTPPLNSSRPQIVAVFLAVISAALE